MSKKIEEMPLTEADRLFEKLARGQSQNPNGFRVKSGKNRKGQGPKPTTLRERLKTRIYGDDANG